MILFLTLPELLAETEPSGLAPDLAVLLLYSNGPLLIPGIFEDAVEDFPVLVSPAVPGLCNLLASNSSLITLIFDLN